MSNKDDASNVEGLLTDLPLELTEEELKHVSAHLDSLTNGQFTKQTVLPVIDVPRHPGLGSAAMTALGRERFHHPIVVAPTPPDIGQNSLNSSVREQLLTSIVSIKPPTLKMTITPEQIQAMARAMGVGNGGGVPKRLAGDEFLPGCAIPPPIMHDCVFWKNARLNLFNPDVPDSVPIFNIPKSDPIGKSNIAGSLGINRFGDFDGDTMMGNWCAPRIISGLLRRKTKKGPKRAWTTKCPHTRAYEKENYFMLSGDQWSGVATNNVMEFLNHGV